jgi:hypothetical protein
MEQYQEFFDNYQQVLRELLSKLTLEEYMVLELPCALECETQYIFTTILLEELKTKEEVEEGSFGNELATFEEVCGGDPSTLSESRKEEIIEFLVGNIDTFDVKIKGDWYHLYMKTEEERLADHQKLVDKIKPYFFKLIEINYRCLYKAGFAKESGEISKKDYKKIAEMIRGEFGGLWSKVNEKATISFKP